MRGLFTDGMNSFWHFIFGFFAVLFWWIIPVYLAYQLWHPCDKNILIDQKIYDECTGTLSALLTLTPGTHRVDLVVSYNEVEYPYTTDVKAVEKCQH